MKTISYWIRGYFGFSQKEASGFIILSSLIILVLITPLIYDKVAPSVSSTRFSDQKILNGLIDEIESEKEILTYVSVNSSGTNSKVSSYFPFDPNSATVTDFERLGIKRVVAERIINYRNKGGKFKIKSDLQKIYGFPAEQFAGLQAYITLPDSIRRTEKKQHTKEFRFLLIDINQADTAQLNKLRGIGNVISARIIKYRDKLGGFVSKDQYKEVYSISELGLEELEKKTFIVQNFSPSGLNINTSNHEVLSGHPYLGRKLAGTIINFRLHHGKFSKADDLKEIIGITPEQIEKIKPYLRF